MHRRSSALLALGSLAEIGDDDRLACVGVRRLEGEVRLGDENAFAIGAGRYQHQATCGRNLVQRGLHGVVVAGAVGCDIEGVVRLRDQLR